MAVCVQELNESWQNRLDVHSVLGVSGINQAVSAFPVTVFALRHNSVWDRSPDASATLLLVEGKELHLSLVLLVASPELNFRYAVFGASLLTENFLYIYIFTFGAQMAVNL